MRIIGIDPGSRKTGFGIIDLGKDRRRHSHIAHGVIRLDVSRDIGERMRELACRLQETVDEYRPTHCALEDIFVAEGLRSALMLGQARGAVLATMGIMDIPVRHFAPTKVKLALTGAGRAGKEQVSRMVQLLLSISESPAQDASDALAIALCCANEISALGVTCEVPKKRASHKSQRNALLELARKQGKIGGLG